MKIDRQSRQVAKKYFLACRHENGSLNEAGVREIVQLLVDQKPRNYLPILTHLYRLIELDAGREHRAGRKRHAAGRQGRERFFQPGAQSTAPPPVRFTRKTRPSSAVCASAAETTSGTGRSAVA